MTIVDPLTQVALEAERHVARAGWDQPARLFALVPTVDLLAHEPGLRETLGPPGSAGATELTAVEQDGLPAMVSIETLLGRLAWPSEVAGAALVVERLVVPPEAERDLPSDPDEALSALEKHPDRRDVRLLAAVLRTGERVCALRQRAHDEDHLVGTGADLAPGLVAALLASFED